MKVSSIRIQNYRSFIDSGVLELGTLNVLIGANNAGKSSILRALHQLQVGCPGNQYADVRVGAGVATLNIGLRDIKALPTWGIQQPTKSISFNLRMNSSDRRSGGRQISLRIGPTERNGDFQLPNAEPHHFIVPFLANRKTGGFGEDIREQHVLTISSQMTNLAAKLSRLSNPFFPAHKQYAEACEAILGFVVTAIPSVNGQQPGVYLPDQSTVPIDQMGEGVPNIVHLLANLAVSTEKLFLIEEPENDLHPQALKALLDLILKSAESNQFVISTHSNIVVSHLCSDARSRLFKLSSNKGELPPVAHIEAVPATADARVRVLQELGYAFSDFDMWDGWLLLEESSAERIIRDYLIPWFAPRLSKVKTVSAGGVANVEPAFKDLHRLMLFTHLQPAYAGRAWVRVDGDQDGKASVEKLRAKFSSIPQEHFTCFEQPQFELYYPRVFESRVSDVLEIREKQARREAKRLLLADVVSWLDEDVGRAKSALSESAESVILDLITLEKELR